jgi:hypothetical protein
MGDLIVMESVGTPLNTEETGGTDFSVWAMAPKERTAPYFPTYSTVSRAMQGALRDWVREEFAAKAERLLSRPHTAYPILVYQCTHPFAGRPTNTFTYDIQQTDSLNRAFVSAANNLPAELRLLDTKRFAWFTREYYFAYRSKEVVNYVMKNRRAIYRMLNVETVLMDSILKFAIIDIPKLGLDASLALLRRALKTQLKRFSIQFDLSPNAEKLLQIMTAALTIKLTPATVISLPLAA